MPKSTNRLLMSVRRIANSVVVILAVLYVASIAVLYTFQRDMIFPGQSTQGAQNAQVVPGMGEELVRLKADGTTVTALIDRAITSTGKSGAPGPKRPTVIFLSGNGSCIAYSTDIADAMRRRGANVLVVDYPGYGMSGGRASDTGCYAAADAAYRYVASRPDCDPNRIISAGWSLGSSVATHLASTRPVAGLAVWSAFTNMAEMSNHEYPMVPTPLVRVMLKYPFPTITEIAGVKAPTFMAHGTLDPLVPLAMPRRLIAAAGAPVTWVPVPGARHNDIFDVGGEALMDRFGQWLAHLPAKTHVPRRAGTPSSLEEGRRAHA